MKIELERLVYPEAAEEVECSLCERPFVLGLVVARAVIDGRFDGGEVCPECALWLAEGPMGAARSEDFPGLEDFSERLAEWQTPEFASAAEADAYWDGLD